jgi:hypothetical protein
LPRTRPSFPSSRRSFSHRANLKLLFFVALVLLVAAFGNACSSRSSSSPVRSGTVRTAASIVAASNAKLPDKSRAGFLCSGDGHDEVVIQRAIDSLPAEGDRTVLLTGDFIKGSSDGIRVPSDTCITLDGTLTLADNLNADACLFTNSDPINGNIHINILGGTLRGNEKNNKSGRQYAVNFFGVTESKVDCRIEDFRTADELIVNSDVNFINQNYSDALTPRIKYLSHCENINDFAPGPDIKLYSQDFFEGCTSLLLSASANQSNSFITLRTFDLRFTPLITMKYKVIDGSTNHFWAYLYNDRLDCYIPLQMYKYADYSSNRWKLALMDVSTIDWDSINIAPSDFLKDARFRLKIEGQEEGATVQILIDDIYAIRGLNQSIVTQVFDDGFASDYIQADYMKKYGYSGVSAIISTEVGKPDYLSLEQLNSLYQSGWDISNHSYSHLQTYLTHGEQWIQDTAGRGYLESLGFSRSAKYRLNVGDQSELNEADSVRINVARRYMGTTDVSNSAASLPYGYTPQVLNYFGYDGSNAGVESKVAQAKKFHTWQIVACHEITDTPAPYKTSNADFQGFIDYLHNNGLLVKNFSEVYSLYPLEYQPQIDFSMKEYKIQVQDVRAPSPVYLCSGQDLSGPLPLVISLENQHDVSRTVTWSFQSHSNIFAFTLVITGQDAKGITQTIKVNEKNGWSGETTRDLTGISVQLTTRTGTGIGDSLQIGIGSRIGLPGKIYSASDILNIKRNGVDYPADKYKVDSYYDTVDLARGEDIANGDNFEITYRSNLNRFAPPKP